MTHGSPANRLAEAHSALRKELIVLISRQRVGRLGIDGLGALSFVYDEGYRGIPLSVSMPIPIGAGESQQPVYGEAIVRPYLFGLLPDSREQRVALGKQCHAKPDDALGILHHVGLDLPGAVQFCPPNMVGELASMANDYVPVEEADIADDLRRIEGGGNPSWQTPQERWSLAGNQPKLAYAYLDNRWWRCEGAAATTHIVKPGIPTLMHEALNETICLRLARACGVPAVEASYRSFEDKTAIVVKRYDRTIDGKCVMRHHQEDICQALSIMPGKKYASDGGPAAPTVARLLATLPNAQKNLIAFTSQLFFNVLVMAPDAHGKNYSLLLLEDDVVLAPLYDCASGAAYKRRDGKPWRLAMGVGGTTAMDRVGARQIKRYSRTVGLDEELCLRLMGNLALRIMQNFDATCAAVREEIPHYGDAVDELRRRMVDPILRHADRLSREVLAELGG